jgi:hypothetical protein
LLFLRLLLRTLCAHPDLVHISTWPPLAPALSVYNLGRRTILTSTLHPTQLPANINDTRASADIQSITSSPVTAPRHLHSAYAPDTLRIQGISTKPRP